MYVTNKTHQPTTHTDPTFLAYSGIDKPGLANLRATMAITF